MAFEKACLNNEKARRGTAAFDRFHGCVAGIDRAMERSDSSDASARTSRHGRARPLSWQFLQRQ